MKLLEKLRPTQTAPEDERREFYRLRCEELTEELEDIRNNFDFAVEPGMIDSLIYAEKSVTCMLEQLIRSAKEEGITIEIHERKKK